MFVLDTNVLIYYAAGIPKVAAFLDLHQKAVFYIPSIVVAEFLSYPLITESAINGFKKFASQTIILNLDFSVAELSAQIKRTYKLKLADAIIAASALISDSSLVTKNIRDFKKVEGLKLTEL